MGRWLFVSEGEGDFGDGVSEGGEEAIVGGGFDELESGEFGEGGENEVLVVFKVEAGEAEGGLAGFAKADAGVKVAGDAGVVDGQVFWIVSDDELIDPVLGNDFEGELMLGERSAAVVVALREDDGNGEVVEPVPEAVDDGGGESVLGVDEVAGNDEAPWLGAGDERGESGKVGGGGSFGDGEAVGAEGGGFAEMEIGGDEGLRDGEEDGPVGQKFDGGLAEGDLHD